MHVITFQRLRIRIENPKGSVRSGKNKETGVKWKVTMPYDYGEIVGSVGTDGDPVDVFIGPDPRAKFAYVIHQTKSHNGTWDEDKCMLGFTDAMEAKKAYYKAYDKPEHFFGSVETIPIKAFREKVLSTKSDPTMIHASKLETTLGLYCGNAKRVNPFTKGDAVAVDGMHGRGVVTDVNGDRVTIRFRHGVSLTRDFMFVHNLADRVKKMWRD